MAEKGKVTLPWIIVGILLLVVIGGGTYIYFDTKSTNAAKSAQAAMNNPAVRAASSLLRLQRDPKVALTAEQKTKLIPVLQELIDAKSPSQDFLKEKAKQINDTLTGDQVTFLSTNTGRQGRAGQSGGTSGGAQGNETQTPGGGQGNWGGQSGGGQGNWNGQRSGQGGQGGAGGQMDPKALYERVKTALESGQ
ncbi:MAG TPA: hypothetical protein VNU93_05090 [Verrucomicrobiae bacterium]|nr:hypothetical protein [Verrucomicrobiae bacterium]